MPYPFAPIPRAPGEWSDVFDKQAIEMSISHNMFIRGLNCIYFQAPGITEAQVKPFVFFCINFFGMLHHHHHIEETLIFPFFDSKMGNNAMGHNTYLKEVQAGTDTYNSATVISKLDSFADLLVEHLRDEIPTLESSIMRKFFTHKELHDLEAQLEKRILAEVSLITTLPLGLICHDKSTAPFFPPLPKPILWAVKYGLYRLHSDAWAFGPCDVNGVLKPGLGNDGPFPDA
ncbi:hypothetical protein C8F01DRAFT_1120468 [Mycena amicta]|nr:hypothetical protein C8F01DRAFT_1120468 [Mycena amicta]